MRSLARVIIYGGPTPFWIVYIPAYIAGFIIITLVMWAWRAEAHDWYTGTKNPVTGYGCCGGNDCAKIPVTSGKAITGGYRITLMPGDHPLVTRPHIFTVPTKEVQFSQDGEYHVCLYPNEDHLRCVFVPGAGT